MRIRIWSDPDISTKRLDADPDISTKRRDADLQNWSDLQSERFYIKITWTFVRAPLTEAEGLPSASVVITRYKGP